MAEAVCGRCGAIFDVTMVLRRPDGSVQWTQAPSVRHGMHRMVHQICPMRYDAPDDPLLTCPHENEAVGKLAERLAGAR